MTLQGLLSNVLDVQRNLHPVNENTMAQIFCLWTFQRYSRGGIELFLNRLRYSLHHITHFLKFFFQNSNGRLGGERLCFCWTSKISNWFKYLATSSSKTEQGCFFLFLMSQRCLKCRLDVERNGLIWAQRVLWWETKLTVAHAASHYVFCSTPNSKIEQTAKTLFAGRGFKVHDLITCESHVQVVVSLGS